ncbi:MAG: response regulator transcription factor [Vulcanimicrobiaceae bacterium]
MRILVIEDDPRLADLLRRGLVESGHVVDLEGDGEAGESTARCGRYDAIVLDVMLPKRSGLAVARGLRDGGSATPILMLTAKDTVADAVAGLDAGADDYLRKPFGFDELDARLRSITRRERQPPRRQLRVGQVAMDLATRRVTCGTHEIALTARETAFLEYFLRNAGRVVTRAMLEDALWERDRNSGSNVIEVYVRRLRNKLGVLGASPPIETIRGAGYRYRDDLE